MKKICLLTILLFAVCAANAQTEISVPTPTLQQKYNIARNFMYNSMLAAISVAKNEGLTVEEYGKKCGEVFATAWNAEMGFTQFANNMLNIFSRLSDSIKIVEQSEGKIVFISSPIYPGLERQGILFGTSLKELIVYNDMVYSEIAKRLNLKCNVKLVEEGLQVEITQ